MQEKHFCDVESRVLLIAGWGWGGGGQNSKSNNQISIGKAHGFTFELPVNLP